MGHFTKIALILCFPIVVFGQTEFAVISMEVPNAVVVQINIDYPKELGPQTFKIEKLSEKDLKSAAETDCQQGLIFKKHRVDKNLLEHYRQLSESIKETSINFNDIFKVAFESKTSNIVVDHCWVVSIKKLDNKVTLWTYNLSCIFPNFQNAEDLKYWYELYLINFGEKVKDKRIKNRFNRKEYVHIVLNYWEKRNST